MDFKCGTQVAEGCASEDRAVEWGTDGSFKNLVEGAVDMATIGIKLVAGLMGAQLSDNLKKAVNAGRCAVNSLGNNAWNLLAAAWWAAKQFGQETLVNTYLSMADEMVCTCRGDVDGLMAMLAQYGMAPNAQDVADFFSSCSEAAAAVNEAPAQAPAS